MISETRKEETITRLVIWGRAVAGGVSGYARIACLVNASAGTSDFYDRLPICPEVELTERAVCRLPAELRAVLKEQYTVFDALAEQRFKSVGVSKSTYYRLHDQAVIKTAEAIKELTSTANARKHKETYKRTEIGYKVLNCWE